LICDNPELDKIDYQCLEDVMLEASASTSFALPAVDRPPSAYVINDSSHGYGLF